MNEIMVSVCCTAYNHEKYIRQAMESFVNQKVDFSYEILINDDVSTDNTANIIKEYEKKYPNLIYPIYQSENQYSKGKKLSWEVLYPKARGKYIALCEGDDYWSDTLKLQKQVMCMEENEDCTLTVHTVRCVLENGELTDKTKPLDKKNDFKIHSEELIESLLQGETCPFQTSSFMFRRESILNELKNLPTFIKECKIGDVTLMMLLATKGNIYFLKDEMSCYRMFSSSSWSGQMRNNKEKAIQHKKNMKQCYYNFNFFTSGKYEKSLEKKILKTEFEILSMEEKFSELLERRYKDIYKGIPVKQKMYYMIFGKFPRLYCWYRKRKERSAIGRGSHE